ncbi:ADOP family duplicated permease [Acidicapsa dinghuensis]|uniref:ADOP family duplicated permease n=1 Tax=Acidicapsa dinghuensis TaxID=2218256 RepID=A0ABW1EMC5_9BACT|nr:ADOP family duplicated permease [Acidicapsa dinghuensis]
MIWVGGAPVQRFLQDVQYALRQLKKSPGFTATAVISLALGIGATTAVFSVIYAILMNPYPYAHTDRFMHMSLIDAEGKRQGFGLNSDQWRELKKSPVIEDAFVEDEWSLTVTGHDFPEDVEAGFESSNMFNFLGVPMLYGRGLQPSDAVDGHEPEPVVVLSYKFWQRHFNSDPSVVGQKLQMVHKDYTIVGIAPSRFTWGDVDVYVPQKIVEEPNHTFNTEIRLKPGVTRDQADAALLPLFQQFAKDRPQGFPKGSFKVHVLGLNDNFLQDLGGTLYLLLSAVALLLLIGCGNVSILLLARGTSRMHEFALRAAVGARRWRIVQQLLTEALLLSLTGAALGVGLAYLSLGKIVDTLPKYAYPHEAAIRINVPVLCFCVAVAILTGVIFGLWPALQMSRPDMSQVMQSGTRKVAGSVRGGRALGSLIAGQIALTMLMLAGAGAALEGFVKLTTVHLGYDPHNIMSVPIPVHENTYKTWADRANYFEQLKTRVAATPGVAMAAISTNATPPSNGGDTLFDILGRPSSQEQKARLNFVSPGYFPALKIGIAQGQIWSETENHNGAPVIVINETMARKYFPKGNALGGAIKLQLKDAPPFNLMAPGADGWLRVVGVIQDKLDDGLRNPVVPEMFVPYTLWMRMGTQILVRAQVSPLTLLPAIRKQIAAVDPEQQTISDPQDLEHWIMSEPEYEQERLVSWLFGAFAVLALLLAAVGLYSVVSYSVAQRTNEFGIRMALGAQREHIWKMAFRSMSVSVSVGVGVGLVLALALNKVVAHWAEGSSRDPLLLAGATMVLVLAAAIACAVPARRAAKTDPMVALRYE